MKHETAKHGVRPWPSKKHTTGHQQKLDKDTQTQEIKEECSSG